MHSGSNQEKAALRTSTILSRRSRTSFSPIYTQPPSRSRMRTLETIQLFLLFWDALCNLTMDSWSSSPLAVLILFALQCIPLCINVVLCGVSAAGYALQYGVDRQLIIRHQVNLVSMLSYIVLTFWWYIWTVRRLWPSVGDHFNFSSSDYYSNHTGTKYTDDGGVEWDELTDSSLREYYTLWSPGFIALYTIQRTFAVMYYVAGVTSVFVLQNEPEFGFPVPNDEIPVGLPGDGIASEAEKDIDPEPMIYGYYGKHQLSRHRGISTISEMSHTVDQNPHDLGRHTPSERSRRRNSTATIASAGGRRRPFNPNQQAPAPHQRQSSARPGQAVDQRMYESPARSHQKLRFENQSSHDESSTSTSASVSQRREFVTHVPNPYSASADRDRTGRRRDSKSKY